MCVLCVCLCVLYLQHMSVSFCALLDMDVHLFTCVLTHIPLVLALLLSQNFDCGFGQGPFLESHG